MTVTDAFRELDIIVARFNSDIEEFKKKLVPPKVETESLVPARPAKIVPPDLFERQSLGIRPKFGDNPARQEAGRVGGWKSGTVRAKSPDRRKRGTVNVASMSVNQHREYWRWCDARKKARKASAPVPSWATWKACVAAR